MLILNSTAQVKLRSAVVFFIRTIKPDNEFFRGKTSGNEKQKYNQYDISTKYDPKFTHTHHSVQCAVPTNNENKITLVYKQECKLLVLYIHHALGISRLTELIIAYITKNGYHAEPRRTRSMSNGEIITMRALLKSYNQG